MVYKKKYVKRNYKRNYGKTAMTTVNVAHKALSTALMVKKLLNVEFKNHDVTFSTATVADGVGSITALTNIAQGDTTLLRDGSSMKVVSVQCKLLLKINASASSSDLRMMIVLDSQTNQAIYTTADLLQSVVNIISVVSPLNLDNKFRFRVLYDKIYNVDTGTSSTRLLKFYKKLDLKIRYDNAAAAITSLTSNSLSVVFISNEPTNEPTVTGIFRVRFIDN